MAREYASKSKKREESKPERKGMSLASDLKMVIESLSISVFGSEFQIAAAVQRKARFANVVLDDG